MKTAAKKEPGKKEPGKTARGLHPVKSDDDVEVGGGSLGWRRRLSVSRRNRRLADLVESNDEPERQDNTNAAVLDVQGNKEPGRE